MDNKACLNDSCNFNSRCGRINKAVLLDTPYPNSETETVQAPPKKSILKTFPHEYPVATFCLAGSAAFGISSFFSFVADKQKQCKILAIFAIVFLCLAIAAVCAKQFWINKKKQQSKAKNDDNKKENNDKKENDTENKDITEAELEIINPEDSRVLDNTMKNEQVTASVWPNDDENSVLVNDQATEFMPATTTINM